MEKSHQLTLSLRASILNFTDSEISEISEISIYNRNSSSCR